MRERSCQLPPHFCSLRPHCCPGAAEQGWPLWGAVGQGVGSQVLRPQRETVSTPFPCTLPVASGSGGSCQDSGVQSVSMLHHCWKKLLSPWVPHPCAPRSPLIFEILNYVTNSCFLPFCSITFLGAGCALSYFFCSPSLFFSRMNPILLFYPYS